jgi:importin subunit alpha-6/7
MGVIPIFAHLLSSPNENVRDIASDYAACHDLVLRAGAVYPLLQRFHGHSQISMSRTTTWVLSSFCRGEPLPDFEFLRPALPSWPNCSFRPMKKTNSCWALSFLNKGPDVRTLALLIARLSSVGGVADFKYLRRNASPAHHGQYCVGQ